MSIVFGLRFIHRDTGLSASHIRAMNDDICWRVMIQEALEGNVPTLFAHYSIQVAYDQRQNRRHTYPQNILLVAVALMSEAT
jgi:hypothetical protein